MREARKEYYIVYQYKGGKEPKFPLNDENMLENLASGLAEPLGHNLPTWEPAWGSGIYERGTDGNYRCVKDNYDTTG